MPADTPAPEVEETATPGVVETATLPPEVDATRESAPATDSRDGAAEPGTGLGLRPEQLTVSAFLLVVVLVGAMLAVAYRRR